jgi:hypothetical protein
VVADGGSGQRRDDWPGCDDDTARTNAFIPILGKVLRGNVFAALAGYSESSLLEERDASPALQVLTNSVFKEAGVVGLFGFVVFRLGGSGFYKLLDDFISGSAPIPVASKTSIDVLLFLPLVSSVFDSFADFTRSSKCPGFVRQLEHRSFVRSRASASCAVGACARNILLLASRLVARGLRKCHYGVLLVPTACCRFTLNRCKCLVLYFVRST